MSKWRTPAENETLFAPVILNGAVGAVTVIREQRPITFLIVSVKQGSVDIWFGEWSGGRSAAPHLHFGQTNRPEWVPLPGGQTVLTVVCSGVIEPTLACVIPGGP